jgi:SAM-dependent methyltransferase
MTGLDEVYRKRFPEVSRRQKELIWPEIVRYLERWVDPRAPVLDVACDSGYFIRNVHASERWAADLRDVRDELPGDVRFVQANGLDLERHVPTGTFGTVFMSNYLEHLHGPEAVIEQLAVARRLLRAGGRLIVLQPNVRLVGGAYWDFIDHRVALTDRSLAEAGSLAGLDEVLLVPAFLPYSTKSRLPSRPFLVRAYLRFPPAWRFLGRQTLYIAEAPR